MWYMIHNDELYHHGILGQKWGKRNGPPYPLGTGDHSASEKKAGWRKSLDNGTSDSYNKRKNSACSDKSEKQGLTDGQKRVIKIGVSAAATVIAVYGGYRIAQLYSTDRTVIRGPSLIYRKENSPYNDSPWDILEKEDRELLKKFQEEALDINVELKELGANGTWEKCMEAYKKLPTGRKVNCGQCTLAGIACFFGQSVVAKEDFQKSVIIGYDRHGSPEILDEEGISQHLFREIIPAAKNTNFQTNSADKIIDYIKEQGPMTTGSLSLSEDRRGNVGHTVQWINLSGVPIIKDNQIGIISGVKTYFYKTKRDGYLSDRNSFFNSFAGLGSLYTVSKESFQSADDLSDFIERR